MRCVLRHVFKHGFRYARKTTIVVALLVLGTVAGLIWMIGGDGTSPLEAWVGQQLQLVAAAYLNPKLSFDDLDYEFPATIRLKKLRLTADDPEHPGKTIDILAASRAQIDLADIPQIGQPIHIASVRLKDPLFQAVAIKGTHRLVGFSDLIRKSAQRPVGAQPPAPAVAAAPATKSVMPVATVAQGPAPQPIIGPPPPRLSDFIRMRRIDIAGGRILYDSRMPGTPAMELDHINTSLDIQPTVDGWYEVQTHIRREPVVELSVSGKLNLDNFTAADVVVALHARLGRENDGYLPPDIQKLVRDHDVQGTLEARITGALPVRDYKAGTLQIGVTLTGANVSFGQYRIPMDRMVLAASAENRRFNLKSLHIEALGGEADCTGAVALGTPGWNSQLHTVVRDMWLDDTIRPGTPAAAAPKYGGRVNAVADTLIPIRDVTAHMPRLWPTAKWGSGELRLDRAHRVELPLIQDLSHTLTKGRDFLTGQTTKPASPRDGDDTARMVFTFAGGYAHCSEITYEGSVFAARGHGTIGFDKALNLTLNAGPLEKMQALMGKVGSAFGKLTDAVACYRVTGRIGAPAVEMEFAGGAVSRVGREVGNGVRNVFGGIEKIGDRVARTDEN